MSKYDDQQAINGLFDRIEDLARNSPPRDRDAEVLIQQRLRDYPPAPYYMAQTIIVQEKALREAQEKIEALERGLKQSSRPEQDWSTPPAGRPSPWGNVPSASPERTNAGGGFLAGAAQTALGVTGGVLLGSVLGGMFTGGAQAGEPDTGLDSGPDGELGDLGGGGDDFDFGGGF
jgi:hypothetical protein